MLMTAKTYNPYISAIKSCMKTINFSMNGSGELGFHQILSVFIA